MIWDDIGLTEEEYRSLTKDERWQAVRDYYLKTHSEPASKQPPPPRPVPPRSSKSDDEGNLISWALAILISLASIGIVAWIISIGLFLLFNGCLQ